jgi:hypothetical protein
MTPSISVFPMSVEFGQYDILDLEFTLSINGIKFDLSNMTVTFIIQNLFGDVGYTVPVDVGANGYIMAHITDESKDHGSMIGQFIVSGIVPLDTYFGDDFFTDDYFGSDYFEGDDGISCQLTFPSSGYVEVKVNEKLFGGSA